MQPGARRWASLGGAMQPGARAGVGVGVGGRGRGRGRGRARALGFRQLEKHGPGRRRRPSTSALHALYSTVIGRQ